MRSKFLRGSNQYKRRGSKDNLWKKYLGSYFALFALVLFFGYSAQHAHDPKTVEAQTIISPLPTQSVQNDAGTDSRLPVTNPTPSVSANAAEGEIKADIRTVFGKYADTAFKLLSCENGSLNPKAINDNTTWGGVGQDIGIFQINNHWQGVSNRAFLEDPAINIRMAYNIFKRSGYTFKMWSCGKKLGI